MTKDIKLCMATNAIHTKLLDEVPRRSGLYQWMDVFPDSEMVLFNRHRDFEAFDVVLVNACMGDISAIPVLVDLLKDSSTKLVVCNDYAVEMWQGYFMQHPWELARSLRGADAYFATEWCSANALKAFIPDEKIQCTPHPANPQLIRDTRDKVLKDLKKQNVEEGVGDVPPQKDIVSVFYHRYDNQTVNPWIVTKDCGWMTSLVGYIHGDKADKKNWITTSLYDRLVAYGSHEDHIKSLIQSKIAYEPSTLHTWGRSVVECAALGLPCFGSNRNAALNHLYPELAFDPFDLYGQRKILGRLVDSEKFRDEMGGLAVEKAEYYNIENSRERFLKVLENGT